MSSMPAVKRLQTLAALHMHHTHGNALHNYHQKHFVSYLIKLHHSTVSTMP